MERSNTSKSDKNLELKRGWRESREMKGWLFAEEGFAWIENCLMQKS